MNPIDARRADLRSYLSKLAAGRFAGSGDDAIGAVARALLAGTPSTVRALWDDVKALAGGVAPMAEAVVTSAATSAAERLAREGIHRGVGFVADLFRDRTPERRRAVGADLMKLAEKMKR